MRQAIKNIAIEEIGREQLRTKIAKIVSVNDTDRTCEVSFLDGNSNCTARLQSVTGVTEGIYVKPSVNSYVAVTFHTPTNAVVVAFSAIDKIEMLGSGDFLARFNELKSGFDELKSDFNTLVTDLNTHTHLSAAVGNPTGIMSASTPPVTLTQSTASIDDAKIDEIETTS